MSNEKYTKIEVPKPKEVMRRDDGLVFGIFGPGTYKTNVNAMGEKGFRPATTAESIDCIAGNISLVKKEILDPRWAQIGRIARTSQGVFVGVTGNEDEATLIRYLGRGDKLNDLFFSRKKARVVFAPYESFKTGVQEVGDFVEGGLAKAFELTAQKAENMSVIASKYPRGVNVWGFEPAKEGEVLHRVVCLYSDRGVGGGRLSVGGNDWDDVVSDGFAFGVSVGKA